MGKSTISDVCKLIEDVEIKYNVFSVKTWKKIPFWPYIRPFLVNHLYIQEGLSDSIHKRKALNLISMTEAVINNFFGLFLFLRKKRARYWFFESSRRFEGKEPYTSSLYKNLRDSDYIKFCYSETWNYKGNNDVIFLNFVKLLIFTFSLLFQPFSVFFINKKDRTTLESSLADLTNNWSYKQKYFECLLWFVFYRLILMLSQPKKIFIVSNTFYIPLIAACEKYDIEVIEIQHGVISNYTLNYSFPNLCRDYFFPNRILLLGRSWLFIDKILPKYVNLQVLGTEYLAANLKRKDNGSNILFISQKPIRNYLIEFINNNREILKTENILFKLHPMEYGDRPIIEDMIHPDLIKNISIIEEEKNISEVMEAAKCQIGSYSTSILEGVQCNIPTLIVNTPYSIHLDYLSKIGIEFVDTNEYEGLSAFLTSITTNYNVSFFAELDESVIDEIITI